MSPISIRGWRMRKSGFEKTFSHREKVAAEQPDEGFPSSDMRA
jgi:hypothetical protein